MRAWPLLLLAACSTSAYLNRDIHTVAVIPTFNGTADLGAADVVYPIVEREVAAKGYRLVPRGDITAFYVKNKFHLNEEINLYRWNELAREWKCDALVYSSVDRWDRPLYLDAVARIRVELIDGRTGDRLWKGEGEASDSENKDRGLFSGAFASLSALGEEACRRAVAEMPLPGYDPDRKPGTK